MNKTILHAGGAISSYVISGVAFFTHASEFVGIVSGVAGAFLTFTIGLVNYAEYRLKMADVKRKEAQTKALALEEKKS